MPLRLSRILILMCVVFCATSVFAQEDLPTYTSSDGAFTFEYPTSWEKLDSTGYIIVSNLSIDHVIDPDYFSVNVSFPTEISQYSMMGIGSSPVEITRYNLTVSYQMQSVLSASTDDFEDGQLEGADQATVQLDNLEITEYTINGYPAAWGIFTSGNIMGSMSMSTLFIAAEVGDGKIVTVQAITLNDPAILLLNQDVILTIADSIRYTPLLQEASDSENPYLSQTYSGLVGIWNMGSLKFNYPDDWYVIPLGPFIQNTSDRIDQANLLPGQLQLGISGPEVAMMPFETTENIMNCNINAEAITAATFIQTTIPTTSEESQQLEEQGIVFDEPEIIELNGREVVVIRIADAKRDVLVLAIDMGSGNIISLMAFTPLGEMAEYEATLFDVVKTFEFIPNIDRCPTDTP